MSTKKRKSLMIIFHFLFRCERVLKRILLQGGKKGQVCNYDNYNKKINVRRVFFVRIPKMRNFSHVKRVEYGMR